MRMGSSTMESIRVRWWTGDMTILVLGATGKTGRRIAAALGSAARPASRSSAVRFDWSDRDTWRPALRDVSAVYVVPSPASVDHPELPEFVSEAVTAGARRLVLLSARDMPDDDPAERAVRESGVDWTILRPTWFAQNFDEDMFLPMVLGREVALPTGDGLEPFIDVDDIAEVAVAALTGPGHAGRVHDLSGPEALSFADATALIGAAIGAEIRYVPVSGADFRAALRASDMPDDLVELVTALLERIAVGGDERLSDGVQRVLGREPRTFADYVKSAAASGVWG